MLRVSLCGLLLVVACSVEYEPSVTAPPPAAETSPPPATTALPPATATTAGPVPPNGCPEGDVMLADGGILDFEGISFDGARIADIGWMVVGDCQTLSISFATEDGAPATTPPAISARILRDAGVLRVETEATASVVVDQLVEQGWVERLFVPVDEDGGHFVDLVLAEPIVARARVFTSPARLELELQPGGPEVGRPLMTPSIVIVEPGSAAEAEGVLDLTGYSTGEGGSLRVEVLAGDRVVTETTLDLEPSRLIWTAFHLVLPVDDEAYDLLRVTSPDGSVVAAIPFSR